MIAVVLAWGIVFAILKATTDPARQNLVNATMIFVLVMAGVATVPQIVSLVRGGPQPKDDTKPSDTDKPLHYDNNPHRIIHIQRHCAGWKHRI